MMFYQLRTLKRPLYALSGFLLMAAVLTSCSCICGLGPTCCDFGRPDVLAYQPTCIIDYNDCFEEYDLCDAPCVQCLRKVPITSDMLNPFQPIDVDYRLARGDVLEIAILDEEETTIENAVIAPDGRLYYMFLNGLAAAGKNPNELSKNIESQLGNMFVNPCVSVSPKDSQTLNYRVFGRVRNPGEFPFAGPVTLREAIAQSGGLLTQSMKEQDYARRYMVPYVDLSRSFIARGNSKLDVDFGKLLGEGDETQNIYLKPGDYIYVAPAETRDVFVLGYVNGPQRISFIPGMTLMSTLAISGGWPTPSPYSPNLERILVVRGSLECPQVCVVDVKKILHGHARDVYLKPGDIVYASHKQFRFGRELVLLAINSFIGNFVGSAAEYYAEFVWFDGGDDDI